MKGGVQKNFRVSNLFRSTRDRQILLKPILKYGNGWEEWCCVIAVCKLLGEALVWIWGCSLALSAVSGREQTPLCWRAVSGGIWQSPALCGCLWSCPCVLLLQLLPRSCPAHFSVLPPERIPVAVTNLTFVVTACSAGSNGLQMFTVCKCCTSRGSRNKIMLLQLPLYPGRWAWVVCAVLLILDLALAPCSSPCNSLCWVPFNLISKTFSFLGKKKACVALLPVCVGSLTSQVGQITWFFPWWGRLVWALSSACYQMSQNDIQTSHTWTLLSNLVWWMNPKVNTRTA